MRHIDLTRDNFDPFLSKLGPFAPHDCLVVGVSGGRDSMALLHITHHWATSQKIQIIAVTFDHGLREASIQEAEFVARICAEWGVDHHTLHWHGPKPTSGLQASARDARYEALSAFCRQKGAVHLLTAHHADDQAETIHMRAQRQKSEAPLVQRGLSGISAVTHVHGVRLLRPLLRFRRAALTHYCEQNGIPWMDDPSNENPAFERVRIRHSPPTLRLDTDTAPHRMQLEGAAATWLVRWATPYPAGWLEIDQTGFRIDVPPSVIHLAMKWAIQWVRGKPGYGPREAQIDRLLSASHQDRTQKDQTPKKQTPKNQTLWGVRCLWSKTHVHLVRESRHLPSPIYCEGRSKIRWDDRFELTVLYAADLAPLGKISALKLKNLSESDVTKWPQSVRSTWPALWENGRLLAVANDQTGLLKASFAPNVPLVPRPFVSLAQDHLPIVP